MENKKSKKGLRLFIIILLFIISFWAYENYTFHTEHISIKSDKITEPFTIVQLTDLHGQSFGKNNSRLINRINRIDPDFIVVTGDMYSSTDESGKGKETAYELITSLDYPVFYVPGEHDRNNDFLISLRDSGVTVLEDEYTDIKINSNNITLYGVDTVYFSPTSSIKAKFPDVDKSKYNILLAHIPNYDLYMPWDADLILSGDSHGGIMQIPFCGPLYFDGQWLPELLEHKNTYDKGLFEADGKYMYVSAGLGNYPLPVRLFNRPELTVITVNPE